MPVPIGRGPTNFRDADNVWVMFPTPRISGAGLRCVNNEVRMVPYTILVGPADDWVTSDVNVGPVSV